MKAKYPATQDRLQKVFSELEELHAGLQNSYPRDAVGMSPEPVLSGPAGLSSTAETVTLPPPAEGEGEVWGIRARRSEGEAGRRRSLVTPQSFLLLYLLGITLAEVLTTLYIPAVGVICHALVLTGMFAQGALTRSKTFQRMLVMLALAPLIRIVSLSLPLQDYVFYVWYLVVGAPLFLSAFLAARYAGIRPGEIGLGFSRWPAQVLIGMLGVGLGYLEYQILRPEPLAGALTLEQVWLPGLILVVFTGLLEEVIFRGLMQKTFVDGLGKLRGVLYVSVVFAVLHVGYRSALDVLFVFGVSLLFGFIALRSRSILGVTLAHGVTNVCLFLVFPFLVG